MRLLSLNCQRAFNPNFRGFLRRSLSGGKNNIFLLQEANDNVVKLAQKNLGKYKIIQHKIPNGSFSEICILYSKKLRCVDSAFSYIEDSDGNEFGVLMAIFKSKKFTFSTANVHLPAYLKPQKRLQAIKQVKENFSSFLKKHPRSSRTIMAGDFNSILPWEHDSHKSILAPFLSPVKNKWSYTYISERLEPTDFWHKLVLFLGKIGFSFRPKLDHVFASKRPVKKRWIRVRSQRKNVSDHLPIIIDMK